MKLLTNLKHVVADFNSILEGEFQEVNEKQRSVLRERFGGVHISQLVYNDHYLIVNNPKNWDYYAGLEYIDEYARITLGDSVIYSNDEDDSDRIQEIIELLKEYE